MGFHHALAVPGPDGVSCAGFLHFLGFGLCQQQAEEASTNFLGILIKACFGCSLPHHRLPDQARPCTWLPVIAGSDGQVPKVPSILWSC